MSSGKPTGNLEHRSLDEDRDRIEVTCVSRQSETHCLKRNCATTTERIEHLGKIAVARPFDFRPGLRDDPRIVGCLPRHKAFEDVEEALPLHQLVFLRGKHLRMSRWVINE
jgi:hypothetical protein